MAPGTMSKNNVLPVWGNDKTMNLNNLILTNIQSSHYFKVNLFELKTYHEVIDEIYYKVSHMEPWEKGSRKTSGQTGMCGGVRGVGAGGIVSTAFCLLYKLFTLKLTRKQVNGLISHCDSPFIRALGFMYIRYTQPPADLWDWYEDYLDDEEELDVKAGTGCVMPIGEMLRHFLTKLEWYSTLFPRIPVPIQKDIEKKLNAHGPLLLPRMLANAGPRPGGPPGESENGGAADGGAEGYRNSPANNATTGDRGSGGGSGSGERHIPDEEVSWGEAERIARLRRSASREKRPNSKEGDRGGREKPDRRGDDGGDRDRLGGKRGATERDYDADLNHEKRRHERRNGGGRDHRDVGENGGHREKDRRHRSRSKDRERRRSRSHSRDRHGARGRRPHRRSRSRDRHRDRY